MHAHVKVDLFLKLKNSTCVCMYVCMYMFVHEKEATIIYLLANVSAPKGEMVQRIRLFLFYISILEIILLIYFNICCNILIYVYVSR